jgi:hypothetical protein
VSPPETTDDAESGDDPVDGQPADAELPEAATDGHLAGGGASDHEELRTLLQRYARAVDDRDIDTLSGLFHPDAELTGARGTETLEEFLTGMRAPRTFPASMHVIADPLIELGPGTGEAILDTYAVVYQLSDPASDLADLTLGIRYLDDAVRHEGRWVLRRRMSRTLWMR